MKTEVTMYRDFGIGSVRQNHKTAEVCLTDLVKIGNIKRAEQGLGNKELNDFFRLNDTVAYLEEMVRHADRGELEFAPQFKYGPKKHSGSNPDSPKMQRESTSYTPTSFWKTKRGTYNHGTWAHPYLAIKLATWMDKSLELAMHKALYDGLLALRDAGGESFKEMNESLDEAFDIGRDFTAYAGVARAVQIKVFGTFRQGAWDSATAEQQEMRGRLHSNLSSSAKYAAKAGLTLHQFLKEVLA